MMCATTNLRSVPCLQAVLLEVPENHCLQTSSGTQFNL